MGGKCTFWQNEAIFKGKNGNGKGHLSMKMHSEKAPISAISDDGGGFSSFQAEVAPYFALTCVSDKLSDLASSFLSAPTTYWFFSKACSSLSNWLGLKAVRMRLGLRKGRRNSGKWGPAREIGEQLMADSISLLTSCYFSFFICARRQPWPAFIPFNNLHLAHKSRRKMLGVIIIIIFGWRPPAGSNVFISRLDELFICPRDSP